MTKRVQLADLIEPVHQFARSVNLERDAPSSRLDGYIPTARALDVVERLARAARDRSLTRAWSITGPYGSGKSSLALLLDALCGPTRDPNFDAAVDLIAAVDRSLATDVAAAFRAALPPAGFIRAVATAQREPTTLTLLRALAIGVERFDGGTSRRRTQLVRAIGDLASHEVVTAREVADMFVSAADLAPVLVVLDEFGKNLEYFAGRTSDADLFVLQEIAERSSGEAGLPVFILTLQHLAFDEYAAGGSATDRREWAKVQGRFEDVPYTDSRAELVEVIARVYRHDSDRVFAKALETWAGSQHQRVQRLGLDDVLPSPKTVAACYPLHPLTTAVLPDLCSRYGQRERTMFSFLARREPNSVQEFLESTAFNRGRPPTVSLEYVFDYFLSSSLTSVGSADGASRWLEIDSRIRETQGLEVDEIRCLKTIGILNLVSQGGVLRASKEVLDYALPDVDIPETLASLEAKGLVVYRAFADEYRIWRGSDFDLEGSLQEARRRLSSVSPAALCTRALELRPLVAARHSQERGILRFFARHVVDSGTKPSDLAVKDSPDGLVQYVLDDTPHEHLPSLGNRPKVIVRSTRAEEVVVAALDVAAIIDVIENADALTDDWVARRELRERAAAAREHLREAFHSAYAIGAEYVTVSVHGTDTVEADGHATWSSLLSAVCDSVFRSCPTIKSEMIARRTLTSQAARARRDLLTAMVESSGERHLRIKGHGPERSMLDALLVDSGIYRPEGNSWVYKAPHARSDFGAAWRLIEKSFKRAQTRRVALSEVWEALKAPPVGLTDGPIPVLVTAALLAHADDIALYQDGTFQPTLSSDVVERVVRSPERFSIKQFAIRGVRGELIETIARRLDVGMRLSPTRRNASVIAVLAPVLAVLRELPEYTRRTDHLSAEAKAVRDAVTSATEPDQLLFEILPVAVGVEPFSTRRRTTAREAADFAGRLVHTLDELRAAYPSMLTEVGVGLAERVGVSSNGSISRLRSVLQARAGQLVEKVLDRKLKSFLIAVSNEGMEDKEWLEYIAMNVADKPPEAWRDEDRRRFDANLEELLGAYRRVEMLHLEQLDAPDGDVLARQVIVTTPEGASVGGVVWLEEGAAAVLHDVVDKALEAASERVGKRAAETLLAVLAERLLGGEEHVARLVTSVSYDRQNAEEARRSNG